MKNEMNVLNEQLQPCCKFPMTGFYRDGYCRTGNEDLGKHIICIQITEEFLKFSKMVGNDLSTPNPDYDFPELVKGDRWCLCALRWLEAYNNGAAPYVVLSSTNKASLEIVTLEQLQEYAVDETQDNWVV